MALEQLPQIVRFASITTQRALFPLDLSVVVSVPVFLPSPKSLPAKCCC